MFHILRVAKLLAKKKASEALIFKNGDLPASSVES